MKKSLAVLCSAVLTGLSLCSGMPAAAEDDWINPGDLNLDGLVGINKDQIDLWDFPELMYYCSDSAMFYGYITGEKDLSKQGVKNCDVNSDKIVNAVDASIIMMIENVQLKGGESQVTSYEKWGVYTPTKILKDYNPENVPELTLEYFPPEEGDTQLDIELNLAPCAGTGISSANFTLKYDPRLLYHSSQRTKAEYEDNFICMGSLFDNVNHTEYSYAYPNEDEDNEITLMFSRGTDFDKDWTYHLKFDILEPIINENERYTFQLQLNNGDCFCDDKGNLVSIGSKEYVDDSEMIEQCFLPFDPLVDGCSFINSNTYGIGSNSGYAGVFKSSQVKNHAFRNSNYINYLSRASGKSKSEIMAECDEEWDGSCYGISATMALQHNGLLDVTKLSNKGAKTYYEMEKPIKNDDFFDTIEYYQIGQSSAKKNNC